MNLDFTKKEKEFIDELVHWERKKSSYVNFYSFFFLFFGVFLIVLSIYSLFNFLVDDIIFWIGIPGILTGIFFILLHIILQRRIKEMKTLSSIIKKMENFIEEN